MTLDNWLAATMLVVEVATFVLLLKWHLHELRKDSNSPHPTR